MSFEDDFGPFDGRVWINCAHQGALPKRAVEAAHEAISWKISPHHLMTSERFNEVPRNLKRALGRLVGAPPENIILGNSASYGLHLMANGFPWREGDEVLLIRGDFPSVILPWLGLERRGVCVRQLEPDGDGFGPDQLERHITPKTRVLCTTWVHSFTGRALDIDALGDVCRRHGVRFIINAAQALGTRPFDVSLAPIDGLSSVGFKWLCGPYGTGFCWIEPELRESLEYNQAYWLAMQTADDLAKENPTIALRDDLGARAYDVFGTANFFNFKPWTASVEYILEQGIDRIAAHDGALVDRLIEGLLSLGFEVLSPHRGKSRSNIVITSHPDRSRNERIHAALRDNDIYIAFRRGNLRFAPHLYNTKEDIDSALGVLEKLG
jgi:selenocysteine lyase/cysteine desulfurase